MGDWKDFPLPDGSYSDDTRPWSHQDVCNYLPTFAERGGTRSRVNLVPAPGFNLFATVGDGPHRGARDVEGKCFVVSGNKLYQVSTAGVATELGTIPGTARVSMTHNQIEGGNQLVIGTGDNSYVWDTSDSTLTATGEGLASVDFLNQLIIGIEPQRRFFRYSGLADALTWNDLDNESAESSPDRIVGAIVSQGEYLVFGERTIEVWQHNPTDSTQFQRTVVIEKGCANANTICRLDNSVYFLGSDFILYRLQGYTPVPVSTKAHVSAFRRSAPTKAFAFTWEDHGYVIYYLTFQDGQTWGYDVTNQRFHRRESFGLDRWRLNTLFKWNGEWFGGDYTNGKLYRLNKDVMHEDGEPIPRKIRMGVLHSAENRVTVHAIRLLMNTGVDGFSEGMTISGDVLGGYVGTMGSEQYDVAGGTGPYTFEIISGSLPPGATMNAGGLVTYTYTTVGTYTWVVEATDVFGATATLADSAVVDEVTILSTGTEMNGTAPLASSLQTGDSAWTDIPRAALAAGGIPLWAGDRWLVTAATGGATKYSSDLVTWTAGGTIGSPLQSSDYGSGWIVAMGLNTISRSNTDGASWVAGTNPFSGSSPSSVRYGNELFVSAHQHAFGNGGPFRISADLGATFPTAVNVPGMTFGWTSYYDSASGYWYLAGGGGSASVNPGVLVRTIDFADFETLGTFSNGAIVTLVKGSGGKWIAVTFNGAIHYTSDDWATHSTSATTVEATSGNLQAAFDGQYFHVADNNGVGQAFSRRSLDGNTWSATITMPQNNSLRIATQFR